MKAADIPDEVFVDAVRTCQEERQAEILSGRRSSILGGWFDQRAREYYREHLPSITRQDVEEKFPGVPWKVLLAKARACRKKGLIDGCCCGCRGDFEVVGS